MLSFWQDYPEIQNKLRVTQELMVDRLKISNHDIKTALEAMALQGGKMVRPALFYLFAGLTAKASDEKLWQQLIKIAASLEILHSATLIHDDIIDDSPLRRGIPPMEAQSGTDVAVYTGDFT